VHHRTSLPVSLKTVRLLKMRSGNAVIYSQALRDFCLVLLAILLAAAGQFSRLGVAVYEDASTFCQVNGE
jgi:hypothetical protein